MAADCKWAYWYPPFSDMFPVYSNLCYSTMPFRYMLFRHVIPLCYSTMLFRHCFAAMCYYAMLCTICYSAMLFCYVIPFCSFFPVYTYSDFPFFVFFFPPFWRLFPPFSRLFPPFSGLGFRGHFFKVCFGCSDAILGLATYTAGFVCPSPYNIAKVGWTEFWQTQWSIAT